MTTTPDTSATDHAFEVGREYGTEQATWFDVGDADSSARILQQLEDGDPSIYDLFPSPLSGEWAGESIPELTSRFGLDLEDSDIADAFEAGYAEGYEEEVVRMATYQATRTTYQATPDPDPAPEPTDVNELFEAQQMAAEIREDYLDASEEDEIPEPTDRDRRVFRLAIEILEEQTR